MPAPTYTATQFADLHIGSARTRWATKVVGTWTSGKTFAQLLTAGVSFEDLLVLAAKASESDTDVLRRLRLWSADCAAHVLTFFTSDYPSDTVPAATITMGRDRARGTTISDAVWGATRSSAVASMEAAVAADAYAAAYSALKSTADGSGCTAAHVWALNAAWANGGSASRDSERSWQESRLTSRMATSEPTDIAV